MTAAVLIIHLCHLVAEECITVLRAVAAERLRLPHLVHCTVQRFDDSRAERQRHVADPKAYDFCLRVLLTVSGDLLCNG